MTALISVVIPCYNQAQFLPDPLQVFWPKHGQTNGEVRNGATVKPAGCGGRVRIGCSSGAAIFYTGSRILRGLQVEPAPGL